MAQANPFVDNEALRPHPKAPSFPADNTYDIPESRGGEKVLQPEELSNTHCPKSAQLSQSQTTCRQAEPSQITRSQSNRGRNAKASNPSTPDRRNDVPPKSPIKRSRSPMKRLLGLVKSSSVTKLEEKEMPTRPITPGSSSKKDSLKKWGDRIRYGFLV